MFGGVLRIGLALAFLTAPLAAIPLSAYAACPDRPPCEGCGCKGGPGYRSADGRCVSFRELTRKCGDPPELRCTFENAPGTGANRECALGLNKQTNEFKGDD
jgi:hypothetical protein